MKCIYLDNNATTPVLPAVSEAMQPYLTDIYGNPASAHHAGRRARQALEDARERTAAALGAFPDEVLFTSGATEANNLAIFGQAGLAPGHIISSPIEHPCVIEPIRRLGEAGFTVDWLPVDKTGAVPDDALAGLLCAETCLVAVMLANHETGAGQPVSKLAQALPQNVAFHCDAAAAAGKVPIRFHALGATTLTLSAHKFHGPKGIGALLVRRAVKLRPQVFGGQQQQGRRPGTEPVALAVGLATALELAEREGAARTAHVARLRAAFLEGLMAHAAPVVMNGPTEGGIPHTLNLSFTGCEADALLMNLDLAGVACSTGSACSSGSLMPSPVLQAMALPAEALRSAMRFSLSHLLTEAEVCEAVRRMAAVVRRLRNTRHTSAPD
jgi:cysteine desulfurase